MKRKKSADDNKSTKEIVKFFFTEKTTGVWICRCSCERKQAAKTGYSNLMSHLRADHPDYEETFKNAQTSNILTYFKASEKASRLYGWIDWVITDRYFGRQISLI
jgi:hypothetical protein